jgi:hypothetical protein
MDSYINNAMLENEKELNGGAYHHQFMLKRKREGGAKPAVATNDTKLLKKVMDFQRRAVRDMESEIKPVGIKEGVDRYKFEKKFEELLNQINAQIEAYLSGNIEDNDTGSVISLYNDLVLYLKNILNYKNLSETEKENIKTEFNNILPQITQLMDIAISQNYVDKKHIEELYNNIVNQNYRQVKTPSYKKQIEEKQPIYNIIDNYSKNVDDIINKINNEIESGLIISPNMDANNRDVYDDILNSEDEINKLLKDLKIVKTEDRKNNILEKLNDIFNSIMFNYTTNFNKRELTSKEKREELRIKKEKSKEEAAKIGSIEKKKQEEIINEQLQFILINGKDKDIKEFKSATRGRKNEIFEKVKRRIQKEAEKSITKEIERRQEIEGLAYDVETDKLRKEGVKRNLDFNKKIEDLLKQEDDLLRFTKSKKERDQIKKNVDTVIKREEKKRDALIKKEIEDKRLLEEKRLQEIKDKKKELKKDKRLSKKEVRDEEERLKREEYKLKRLEEEENKREKEERLRALEEYRIIKAIQDKEKKLSKGTQKEKFSKKDFKFDMERLKEVVDRSRGKELPTLQSTIPEAPPGIIRGTRRGRVSRIPKSIRKIANPDLISEFKPLKSRESQMDEEIQKRVEEAKRRVGTISSPRQAISAPPAEGNVGETYEQMSNRLQGRTGQGKPKVSKKLKSKELFELFKKLPYARGFIPSIQKPKGRGAKNIINEVVEVIKRGRGRPRKVLNKELKTPSQKIYDEISQLNREKIYGTGKYIANAVRRKVPESNGNDIQPMPSSFIDHFQKVEKLSKKN